jgi:hypothetical protein
MPTRTPCAPHARTPVHYAVARLGGRRGPSWPLEAMSMLPRAYRVLHLAAAPGAYVAQGHKRWRSNLQDAALGAAGREARGPATSAPTCSASSTPCRRRQLHGRGQRHALGLAPRAKTRRPV